MNDGLALSANDWRLIFERMRSRGQTYEYVMAFIHGLPTPDQRRLGALTNLQIRRIAGEVYGDELRKFAKGKDKPA